MGIDHGHSLHAGDAGMGTWFALLWGYFIIFTLLNKILNIFWDQKHLVAMRIAEFCKISVNFNNTKIPADGIWK